MRRELLRFTCGFQNCLFLPQNVPPPDRVRGECEGVKCEQADTYPLDTLSLSVSEEVGDAQVGVAGVSIP